MKTATRIEEWRFGVVSNDEPMMLRFHYVVGTSKAHAKSRLEELIPDWDEIRETRMTAELHFENLN